MINEEQDHEGTWASVPATSYIDGYDPDYDDYLSFDRLACDAPNSYDPLPAEPHVWFNEIHYDNLGGDVNEGFEVAGSAGVSLAGWTTVFYNGNGGGVAATKYLDGTIPDEQAGFGTRWWNWAGVMENGAPDGIALVGPSGSVIQFLSWEGTMTAVDGPAQGLESADIGVQEGDGNTGTDSLQLHGTGNDYSDFTWAGPEPNTQDVINTSQLFQ
jgi:hypothetical protein